ncbi:MAG: NAD-dependent epimerase/dehydratase family protein [Marmoricola sp.]
MRLLVLGGTLFLSRAVAADAVARGHEVTCAARGQSGAVPEGARHVVLDRAAPDWSALQGEWDSVVDVGRTPSWVAGALDALVDRIPHWVFVSSISVYADHATPGGSQDTLPLLEPITEDVEQDTPDRYGASKVGCEQLVQSRAAEWLVVRPGLIAGPGDPSGRLSYWPERLAEGGDVLAPESPDRPTQVIDVRDLAAWIVTCAEHRQTGVYDATGHVTGLGSLLDEIARRVGGGADLVWADATFLAEHDVRHWSGPRSLPLWVPEEGIGLATHDVSAAFAAGLTTRPVAETAADTLAWLRSDPDAARTGLTRAEEQAVLDDWYAARQ